MTKTAIITVPRLEPHRPPAGPAIIAAVCERVGHDVTSYDLNIEFFHYCKSKGLNYYDFDRIWDEVSSATTDQQTVIDQFIDKHISKIIKHNYDYILVSVFGYSCKIFASQFLTKLRPLTNSKIVAGGMAIDSLSLLSTTKCFGDVLRDKNLIDDYITGEGEVALKAYFANEDYPGINNIHYAQIDDLNSLEWPEYKYFDLDKYDYLNKGVRDVYITGSRGCVRRCGYCDIENYWPKFRYRSGKNIAREIIKHYEDHGITNFYFTDSLVNGSKRAFTDMCNALVSYNFDTPIKWKGQFIFRRKHNVDDDHFTMIAEAGGDEFYVGLETGSDRLRYEMGKKFTNEDTDYQLEQFSRTGLKVMPLMFTGYVTETLQDHLDTLSIFKRWQKYVADGTITAIELGANLIILPGSPVERMIQSHGIEFAFDSENEPVKNIWQSTANPDLTIHERIRRKLELHEEAIKYNWPVWRQAARLTDLKHLILSNNLHKETPKFFPIPVASK